MQVATIEDRYPSRVASEPSLTPRVDPVVYDGGPVGNRLSFEDQRRFESDGYLFVENLFDATDVRDVLAELRAMVGDADLRSRDETITEPGSDSVRSIFRVHELSKVCGWLAQDVRVLDVARQILGSEVYIHQSRANLKPGFAGKEFYWHSDFETWHVEDGMPSMRALSVSIALTENYPFNGPLMVIPQSHKTYVSCVGRTPNDHYKHSLKKQEYGVPDNDSLKRLVDHFRDVLDLQGVVIFQSQPALFEVADAVGARGREHRGPGVCGLPDSDVGESLLLWCLHPDPATAPAATEAVLA